MFNSELCTLDFCTKTDVNNFNKQRAITIEIFYQTDLGPKPYDCLWPRLFPLPRPGLMFVTSANCSKRLRCCRNSGSSLRFILTGASGILSFQHPVKKESSFKYSLRVLRKKSGYFARLSSRFIENPKIRWNKVKQENNGLICVNMKMTINVSLSKCAEFFASLTTSILNLRNFYDFGATINFYQFYFSSHSWTN